MMTFQAELDSGKSRSKTVTSNAREDHKMKTRYRMLYAILGVAHAQDYALSHGSSYEEAKIHYLVFFTSKRRRRSSTSAMLVA